MKRSIGYVVGLLVCVLFLAALPTAGEAEIYDGVIRLHVLAASDSPEDQADKLAVRDAIFAQYGAQLSGYPDKQSATAAIEQLMPSLAQLAEQTLAARGVDKPVRVTLTEEQYERREYASFTLPAGTYTSLRVLIGEGEGKNWWCVLFPPLCIESATGIVYSDRDLPQGLSHEEYALLTGAEKPRYELRFKLLEVLGDVFSR